MSKVENIEHEVQALTRPNLPLSVDGFLSLTLKFGIARSKRMFERGD